MGKTKNDWAFAYQFDGLLMLVGGVCIWFFLESRPKEGSATERRMGRPLLSDYEEGTASSFMDSLRELNRKFVKQNSLVRAVNIPGVLSFSLSLLLCKMASYGLMFWGN